MHADVAVSKAYRAGIGQKETLARPYYYAYAGRQIFGVSMKTKIFTLSYF